MEVNPLLVAFIVLLLIIVYRYLKETYTIFERLNIPGPKPVWVFGNVKEFKDKHPLDVFQKWKKIYGKVFGFYEGFRAGIVVNDPEWTKLILSKNFENFHIRTPYQPFQYFPSNLTLVNLQGEHWRNQRYMMNKLLNFGNGLQPVVDKIVQRGKLLVSYIEMERYKLKGKVEMSEIVSRFVSSTTLSLVTSLEGEELEDAAEPIYRYQQASKHSSAADNPVGGLARLFPSLAPFLQLFDGEHRQAHEKAVSFLRCYLHKITEEKNNNSEESKSSLVSELLSCKVPMRGTDGSFSGRKLTEDEIIAHVLALLCETLETTTAAILFLLYELALHPTLQDKVYEELKQEYKTEDDEIEYTQLQNLSYLDMFYYETLRLYPIAPGISRLCANDCIINGIQFKKGMTVRTMTCTIYQDEKYFPEPEKFDPERFSSEGKKDRHPFAFIPYGQGPRMCPGVKLSTAVVKLTVIGILRKYSLHTNENTEIPLKTALRPSLCPANGVNITFKERC